jgi:DNA primase
VTFPDDVKDRLDIVEIISGYVQVKKAGRSYTALCPFHSEKTPSFFIFPERRSWRCFGACATGGDVFSFVMKAEGKDFAEILRLLAHQAGLALPRTERSKQGQVIYAINEAACAYYQQVLASPSSGAQAMAYIKRRGIDTETLRRFELGFAPSGGHSLKRYLLSLGHDEETALLAGLLVRTDAGNTLDMFRSRLIFPIRDVSGKLVGFGGRVLREDLPKYLNSPKTEVFDKGDLIYAMHLAKDSIKELGVVVIVEGYMDVIAAHQHGFSNVVASMGTALTEHQVTLLGTIAKNFLLALDPDIAGQEATLRSMQGSWRAFERKLMLKEKGIAFYERPSALSLKVASLPVGKDPDKLIREDTLAWENILADAESLMDYLLRAMATRSDLTSARGKMEAAERLFPLVAAIENPFEQRQYFLRLAELLQVSEATLVASVGRPNPVRRGASARNNVTLLTTSPFLQGNHDVLEEYFLSLILIHPELGRLSAGVTEEHFHRVENREVFTSWVKSSNIEALGSSISVHLAQHLEYLTNRGLPAVDFKEREAALVSCVRRLEERRLRDVKAQEVLAFSEDNIGSELTAQAVENNERLRRLFEEA